MKAVLKTITPPFLWELAQQTNRLLRSAPPKQLDPAMVALEAEFQKINQECAENEMRLRAGLNLAIHPESRAVFEHFCYRSLEMTTELNCFLSETRQFKRLFDIGALHGIFALVFTKDQPDKQALAVDASPIAFARLLYNLHRNPTCAVMPVECALSDREGQLPMHYEWEHAVAAGSLDKVNNIVVPMTTGDELCRHKSFEPDVIKIDVEGHEIKVLRGLRQTMQRYRPAVFLELHPARIHQEGDPISFLADFLGGLGYSARTLSGMPFALSDISGLTRDERLFLTA